MQTLMKAVVAIFISDKADFRAREISKHRESHYMMIKLSV